MGFCFIIIYLTKTILLLALYYHIILNINMRVLFNFNGVQRNCGSASDTKPCAAPLKRFTMTLGSFVLFLKFI